jgi:hypothetical protein
MLLDFTLIDPPISHSCIKLQILNLTGDTLMKGTIKKFLLGATVVAGMSGIASAPAHAALLAPQNITFNTTNYQTYTGGNSGSFIPNNSAAAINALTDNDPTSNVELWYTTENPTANVGFNATLGGFDVSVSSVTGADWANFGNQWLTDLLTHYGVNLPQPAYNAVLNDLIAIGGLPRANDPNVGAFTYDTNSGKFDLTLVGHYDLRERIATYLSGNPVSPWNALIQQAAASIPFPLQASEIAKVSIAGNTYYAYSFNATNSGIATTDGTESYTGLYHWDPIVKKSVPEPSAVLGLMAVGGLFIATRKLKKS